MLPSPSVCTRMPTRTNCQTAVSGRALVVSGEQSSSVRDRAKNLGAVGPQDVVRLPFDPVSGLWQGMAFSRSGGLKTPVMVPLWCQNGGTIPGERMLQRLKWRRGVGIEPTANPEARRQF